MSASHDDERSRESAARGRVARLEASLAADHAGSSPPGDDEISAYVDGTLDDVAREIFETRLADDPALQAEVEGLRELRKSFAAPPSRPRFAAGTRVWIGVAAAIVVMVTGTVLWLSVGGPTPIRLDDSGGIVVMHGDGRVEGLGPVPADLEQSVRQALRTGIIPLPTDLDRLRVAGSTLMSGNEEKTGFGVVHPAGTLVRTDRPLFQWRPLASASGYRVSVYDERLGPVIASPALLVTEWTPIAALPRGVALLWQVEATTPGGRVVAPSPSEPQARFEILSEARAQALEDRLDASPLHIVRAVIFAEAGLIDETRAEIRALKQQNPEAGVLDVLLGSLDRLGVGPTP